MRRFVSIWLPRWPIDRRRRAASRDGSSRCAVPAEPFALTLTSDNAVRLSAVNEAAATQGLYTDMMLTNARSLVPDLRTARGDPENDARALARLARWFTRYSPWTNVDGVDGVLLDVTGCAHLFGGEAGLLGDMEHRLTDFGFAHRLGLADTPGAAHALARYGRTPVAPQGGAAAALSGLPVEALRLDLDTATLLKRLGLKRIGQLYDMPRAALARRFRSPEKRPTKHLTTVLTRLDQALGLIDEPLSPLLPVPDYRAGLTLAEPVQEVPAVTRILTRLADDLCGTLKESGLGAQRLSLLAYRVDGTVAGLTVGASRPTQDPRHVERLFAEHLEELDAGFGIDRVVLGAERVAPLTARQSTLAPDTDGTDEETLARLIDRLAARFGGAAVTRLKPRDSHIPERVERAVPALDNFTFNAPHPPAGNTRGPLPLPMGEAGPAEPPGEAGTGEGRNNKSRRTADEMQLSGETKTPVILGARDSANPETPCNIARTGPRQAEDDRKGIPPPNPLSSREREGPAPRQRRGRVRGGDDKPPRPFLLLERPEPVAVMAQIPDGPPLRFRWRRVVREVARAEGPERIAPEWWLVGNTDNTRDYYRVEDSLGRRYWLYREGLYGGAESPRWFVHGVFG